MELLIIDNSGFVGNNRTCFTLRRHSLYQIINRNELPYLKNLNDLNDFIKNPNDFFIRENICDITVEHHIFISKLMERGRVSVYGTGLETWDQACCEGNFSVNHLSTAYHTFHSCSSEEIYTLKYGNGFSDHGIANFLT